MKIVDVFREGTTKVVYNTEEKDKFIIKYKDDITAFNGEKTETLIKKGRINNKISAKLFNYLETVGGIRTHFIYLLDDEHVLVEKTDMIPIEVRIRNKAAGRLLDKSDIYEEGDTLPNPIIEYYIKDEVSEGGEASEEILLDKKLVTLDEIENIKRISLKVNNLLKIYFDEISLDLIDLKIEYGRQGRELLLIDEISPDSCRLWDKMTGKKLDRDLFREDSGDVIEGYQEVLERMKNKR